MLAATQRMELTVARCFNLTCRQGMVRKPFWQFVPVVASTRQGAMRVVDEAQAFEAAAYRRDDHAFFAGSASSGFAAWVCARQKPCRRLRSGIERRRP